MLDSIGLGGLWPVILVVLSFSVLIFVHELGHYIACRLTGIRVERFFIGFDFWGMGLSKKIGGTVYGIGIVPLGGYVKPAGQSDNPTENEITGAPDELPSKPLWAQATVFAAGAFMNFVLGFIILLFVYMHGMPYIPAVVGGLPENSQAKTYGLEVGDRILSIDGKPVKKYMTLLETIAMTPEGKKVLVEYERIIDGKPVIFKKKIMPLRQEQERGKIQSIGVTAPLQRTIISVDDSMILDYPEYKKHLKEEDEILSINGIEIHDDISAGFQVKSIVKKLPGNMVTIKVRGENGEMRSAQIPIYANAQKVDFGFRYAIKVTGIEKDSPAEKAGLVKNNLLLAAVNDDKPEYFKNLEQFTDIVKRVTLRPVDISVIRNGQQVILGLVKPIAMPGDSRFGDKKDNFLGVLVTPSADKQGFVVESTLQENSVFRKGDIITKVASNELVTSRPLGEQVDEYSTGAIEFMVQENDKNGAVTNRIRLKPRMNYRYGRPMVGVGIERSPVITQIEESPLLTRDMKQKIKPGMRIVAIGMTRDLKTIEIMVEDKTKFSRGTLVFDAPKFISESLEERLKVGFEGEYLFRLRPLITAEPAAGFADATVMAGKDWLSMGGMVFGVLNKLITRKWELDAVGGPVMVFTSIYSSYHIGGFYYLLRLIAMISINLGIINLLPFPVLDGGHILFLLIHWIKGSPPSEKLKETAQYVGMVCLLSLILVVSYYDIKPLLLGS